MNKRHFTPSVVGVCSLLVIFSVLCLVIFSLVSLSTANAGKRLSEISARQTEAYYAADLRAEKIVAQLRAGSIPEGVSEKDGVYSFSVAISDVLVLSAEVEVLENGDYKILKWQSVRSSEWQADDSLDLWDGES